VIKIMLTGGIVEHQSQQEDTGKHAQRHGANGRNGRAGSAERRGDTAGAVCSG
jgi:hypothetical protein